MAGGAGPYWGPHVVMVTPELFDDTSAITGHMDGLPRDAVSLGAASGG